MSRTWPKLLALIAAPLALAAALLWQGPANHEVEPDYSAFPRSLEAKEAPMLAWRVQQRLLPALEQRLPENPIVQSRLRRLHGSRTLWRDVAAVRRGDSAGHLEACGWLLATDPLAVRLPWPGAGAC